MKSEAEISSAQNRSLLKLPLLAALLTLVGLADAIYLTYKHYTGGTVPCSIVDGCETVLTSSYSQIAGVPLAIFGAAAYAVAFSLAILAAYGNRPAWTLFGVQVGLMAVFTAWLIYLQAYVIEAFCQFCLLSAATTFSLLIIFSVSKFRRLR